MCIRDRVFIMCVPCGGLSLVYFNNLDRLAFTETLVLPTQTECACAKVTRGCIRYFCFFFLNVGEDNNIVFFIDTSETILFSLMDIF